MSVRRPEQLASVRLRFCLLPDKMKSDDESEFVGYTHTKDNWFQKLEAVELYESDLHNVLMNYFTVNGYQEVAEEFLKETNVEPEMPLDSIGRRKQIREAVLRGDMEEAINIINLVDSQILASNPEINFLLKQQQLLQLIEKGEATQAIEFAQRQLAPCIRQNPDLLPQLEETMSLLAFNDLNSKIAQKLLGGMDQLEKAAKRIDEVILDFYQISQDSILEYLAKNALWSQNKLGTDFSSSVPILAELSLGGIESAYDNESSRPVGLFSDIAEIERSSRYRLNRGHRWSNTERESNINTTSSSVSTAQLHLIARPRTSRVTATTTSAATTTTAIATATVTAAGTITTSEDPGADS